MIDPCGRCGKMNQAPVHTCSPSQYVVDLESKLARAERLIRGIEQDAENATEFVLCDMYARRGKEIEELRVRCDAMHRPPEGYTADDVYYAPFEDIQAVLTTTEEQSK